MPASSLPPRPWPVLWHQLTGCTSERQVRAFLRTCTFLEVLRLYAQLQVARDRYKYLERDADLLNYPDLAACTERYLLASCTWSPQ